jgi:hypothetical protein
MAKRHHSASQKAVTDSLKASIPIHTRLDVEDDSPWDSDPESMGEACLHRIAGTALHFALLQVFRTNERGQA